MWLPPAARTTRRIGAGRPFPGSWTIPADFKVTKSDWVDEERASVGWPLGDRSLRGKTIRETNGLFPVHIMLADLPEFEGAPLLKDDLIIGVDGVAFGKDGVDQMCNAVRHAMKNGKPVNVTRWRSGVIETFPLDFRLRKKRFAVPDLTNGGKPDETRDWTLGPIGANGWGFSLNTAIPEELIPVNLPNTMRSDLMLRHQPNRYYFLIHADIGSKESVMINTKGRNGYADGLNRHGLVRAHNDILTCGYFMTCDRQTESA